MTKAEHEELIAAFLTVDRLISSGLMSEGTSSHQRAVLQQIRLGLNDIFKLWIRQQELTK